MFPRDGIRSALSDHDAHKHCSSICVLAAVSYLVCRLVLVELGQEFSAIRFLADWPKKAEQSMVGAWNRLMALSAL